MALFQPSQIVPDVRSGIGLGVVDATQGMTVSWHINGQSALVKFSIEMFANDAQSTQKYSSGILTDGCPAYGTTSAGAPQLFSYFISATDLADGDIVNGNEYKMVITQWWSETESVTQSSASVFVTRADPTLTVSIAEYITGIQQGNIQVASGEPSTVNQNRRIRTSDYFPVTSREIIATWDTSVVTQAYVYYYRSDNSYIMASGGWVSPGLLISLPDETAKIKMVFRSGQDNANITPQSVGWVRITQSLNQRYWNFTGAYSQAQGDILNWFRWEIEDSSGNTLLDTGNISGTMDISCSYDGFFSGESYRIRLTAQTENGAEADTGWISFSAYYPTSATTGIVTAGCVGGTDAVLVEWSGIGYIPGEASGEYAISDDFILTLAADSVITWNSTGAQELSFAAPWSVIWKGSLGTENADIFFIGQGSGAVSLSYSAASAQIQLRKGSTVIATQTGIINQPSITALLTGDTLYLRVEYMSGGLYPSATLYPSQTQYPLGDTVPQTSVYTIPVSYTQETITYAAIGGWQECDFFEVVQGAASAETIQQAITDGDYAPGLNDSDYMLAQWNDGLNAGNVNLNGDSLVGYSLYRRQGTSASLVKIADTDISVTRLFDYAALSQQGPYTYYLFPTGENTYIAQPITSGMVMPCWWNWTLMECAQDGDSGIYTVLSAYRFKLNVATGDVSNNNAPNILQNFTPYPKVQLAPQNYKSGSLTALIGAVDWSSGQPEYVDSTALRDRIFALSVTQNPLFLKTRKGELIRIRVSGAISMQTNDATREQTQTMTLPWVETGSAQGVSLYSATFAGVQEPEGNYVPQFYVDASDATATAKNIRVEKTAYGAGGKIIGEADVSVVGNTLVMPEGMEE